MIFKHGFTLMLANSCCWRLAVLSVRGKYITPDPKAWERWGCCSSMLPGAAVVRQKMYSFQVCTHTVCTHTPHICIYMANHTDHRQIFRAPTATQTAPIASSCSLSGWAGWKFTSENIQGRSPQHLVSDSLPSSCPWISVTPVAGT